MKTVKHTGTDTHYKCVHGSDTPNCTDHSGAAELHNTRGTKPVHLLITGFETCLILMYSCVFLLGGLGPSQRFPLMLVTVLVQQGQTHAFRWRFESVTAVRVWRRL